MLTANASRIASRSKFLHPVEELLFTTCLSPASVQHGATLPPVPTSHPRHTITETPHVREALDELRTAMGRERIDFGELTILGARTKLADLRTHGVQARAARERLAREIRGGETEVDVAAADQVKRLRLTPGD